MKLYKEASSRINNKGLFANKDIKKGTKIINYIGKIITKKQTDENPKFDNGKAIYLYNLNNRYDLDGDFKYNTARLINHSCNPNCDIEIENNEIWVISKKNIRKHQELNYNYGYAFDTVDVKDHPCKCGAKNCVGYILDEDDWPKLKKFKKKLTKV